MKRTRWICRVGHSSGTNAYALADNAFRGALNVTVSCSDVDALMPKC